MPTAPAGAGESEAKQLPQRGMRERESRKGKNTMDSKEPKTDTVHKKEIIRGSPSESGVEPTMVRQVCGFVVSVLASSYHVTQLIMMRTVGKNKQTSDEQALINSVYSNQDKSMLH